MPDVNPELGFYALAGQPESPRDLIDELREGEAMGLGTASLSERYNSKEICTLSGAAGAVTDSIRIATAATNHNTRHPMVTASWAMTMHKLSGGRFALGLGRGTAASVDGLMSLFTSLSARHDHLVTYDGFTVAVVVECVGVLEMLIYSACVLAFPAPVRTRALGVVLGCIAIFVFNLLRIMALLVVGKHWHEAFDFFHLYFWQATLIAMIVGVLLGWIRIFVRR